MIPADFRLGELLTRADLLPRARLDAALERQAKHNGKLGALLVDLGLIDEAELYAVLALERSLHQAQAEDVIRLGRMLLEASIVDSTTLEAAIRRQRGARVKVGDALLEMGAITQDVLQAFLKRQRRLLAALSAGMAAAAEAHGLPARS